MPENSIRGYAWFVRPGIGTSPDPRLDPWGATPVPRISWLIGPDERGVHNRYGNLAYVAVTDGPMPPDVLASWEVEPAALDTDFDAAGVRLIRAAGFRETPHGCIPECVFEVAGLASG